MPKLLSEYQLNEVRYVSISDYIRKMDEIEDLEDKMAFTTRYLLAYGGEERDVPLAEAIHIAKLKIADASAKLREDTIMVPNEAVDPRLDDAQDAVYRQFMIEPLDYLKGEAVRLLNEESQKQVNDEIQQRIDGYQVMYAVLANDLNGSLSNQISEREIQPTSRDVDARLKAKFGGAQEFENAYKATKPGVLSKMFGTSSRAYHNLEEVYQAFNNPDHALYGDMNSLDKAATEYLKHVFPKWDPRRGGISKSAINALSGTKKARALFSLNILKVTAEQRKSEPVFETIVEGNLQKRADAEAAAGDEVLENPQVNEEQFQQGVLEDVAEQEPAGMSDEEKAYHDNFVIGPENDNDEPNID